jgi:FMN phosphatase YigB (HAD superfamily)
MEPVISFDLDHTLMINPFRRWVFPEIEAWLSPQLPASSTAMEYILREHRSRLTHQDKVAAYDWDGILEAVCQQVQSTPPFTIKDLVHKHAVIGKVWLYADTLPSLHCLKQKKIPLIAATNGWECYQRPVTDCLGITSFFSEYHTPVHCGAVKPEASFFDFRGHRSLIHVGDRLNQDILGANRAGVTSVWIHRELDERWHGMDAAERKLHPDFRRVLTERLHQEGHTGSLSSEYVPDYVIVSLEELLPIWERERSRFSGSTG